MKTDMTPAELLDFGIDCNSPEHILRAIQNGASVNQPLPSDFGLVIYPVHSAACIGALDALRTLVEHGADFTTTNRSGYNAHAMACMNNHADVADYLADLTISLKQARNTLLQVSTRRPSFQR